MFATITNGFNSVLDFLDTIISFIGRIVSGSIQLIASIPDILRALTLSIGLLPTFLLSAALFCISVKAIVIFLNHNAGGD